MTTEKEIPILTDDLIPSTAALLEKIAFAIRSRNVLMWTEQEAAIADEFARRLKGESATVIATTELEALRKDAERYRWLRKFNRIEITYGELVDLHVAAPDAAMLNDRSIDAAIAQEKAK